MKHNFSNRNDMIDSRDIIARIEELQDEKEEFILNESETDDDQPSWGEIAESQGDAESKWDETEEGEELKILLSIQDDVEGYASDWKYGVSLVRDSYFAEYAKEFCKDVGYISSDMPSLIEYNINWQGVAEDLQADYTEVDFDGVKYWVQCN